MLAHALLGELDAHDVGPGGRRVGDQPLLGRDAEEVVGVVQPAVLDEQRRSPPKREPWAKITPWESAGELDLGQDLVGDVDACWRPTRSGTSEVPG